MGHTTDELAWCLVSFRPEACGLAEQQPGSGVSCCYPLAGDTVSVWHALQPSSTANRHVAMGE